MIISWVGHQFFGVNVLTGEAARALFPLLDRIRKVATHRGIPSALEFVKNERAKFLYELSLVGTSQEAQAIQRIRHTWGTPLMSVVQKLKSANPDAIYVVRIALTALTSLRFVRRNAAPDISSVTSPGSGKGWNREEVKKAALAWWGSLGVKPQSMRRKLSWRSYHLTSASGPNGPALWMALRDLASVKERPGLWSAIRSVGGTNFRKTVDTLTDEVVEKLSRLFPTSPGECVRRICALPDSEGKVRVIAMADYWTQTVLKPFHDWCKTIQDRLEGDMVRDQDRFKGLVESWVDVSTYYSLDLTTATDRFPREFIADVFEPVVGKQFISSWLTLMADEPFLYKGPGPQSGEFLKFEVGTPLGVYGSFAPFALAVHFIQWWAGSSRYCAIGDDFVTADGFGAEFYSSRLAECGVEVSEKKTFRSPRLVEFAKRHLFKTDFGFVEITGFPVSLVWGTEFSVPLLASALLSEGRKGIVPQSGIPGAIKELDGRLWNFYESSWSEFVASPRGRSSSGPLPKRFHGSRKRARIRARVARQTVAVLSMTRALMSVEDCLRIVLDGLKDGVQEAAIQRGNLLVAEACGRMLRNSFASLSGSGSSVSFIGEVIELLREGEVDSSESFIPASAIMGGPEEFSSFLNNFVVEEDIPNFSFDTFKGHQLSPIGDDLDLKILRILEALPITAVWGRMEGVSIRTIAEARDGISKPLEE